MKEILITAINYKCENETLAFVNQLSKQTAKEKIAVVIVDNAKSDPCQIDLEEELKKAEIDCYYYFPDKNLGYLNGCFYGVEQYKANNPLPKWIVVSNTDIEISDEEFFSKFFNGNYSDDTWVVGPSIQNDKEEYSNPFAVNRISLSKINRNLIIFKTSFRLKASLKLFNIKRKFKKKESKKESQFVYAVHGCFFFIRDELYNYSNEQKYGAFLYGEESYFAEMTLKANKKAFYDSEIELLHKPNLAIGKLATKRRAQFMFDATKYLKEKFYNS